MGYLLPSGNIIFIVIYCFLILILNKISKNNTLIIIIISWWFFWNALSNSGIAGYYTISYQTQIVYYIFFLSLVFGVFLEKKITFLPMHNFFKINDKIQIDIRFEHFIKFLLYIIVPITFQFFVNGMYLQFTKFDPSAYRQEVFGLNTGRSELFYNSFLLAYFYWMIILPIYWVSLILGISRALIQKKYDILIISLCLFVMYSLMTAGRFGFHYTLLTILTIFLLKFKDFLRYKTKKKIQIAFLLLICITVLISFLFTIRSTGDIKKNLIVYLIGYHTVSFTIFDLELKNLNSILHDNTHGTSFFSGLINYPDFILSQFFGINLLSEYTTMGGYLHSNRLVGFNPELGNLYNNAFGSIFFAMYRDGGLFFTSIYGILFGYFYSYLSKGFKKSNIFMISCLFVLYYTLIYGIFKLFIDGEIFPALIVIFLFFKFRLKIFKSKEFSS